jgi:hypothetical protein
LAARIGGGADSWEESVMDRRETYKWLRDLVLAGIALPALLEVLRVPRPLILIICALTLLALKAWEYYPALATLPPVQRRHKAMALAGMILCGFGFVGFSSWYFWPLNAEVSQKSVTAPPMMGAVPAIQQAHPSPVQAQQNIDTDALARRIAEEVSRKSSPPSAARSLGNLKQRTLDLAKKLNDATANRIMMSETVASRYPSRSGEEYAKAFMEVQKNNVFYYQFCCEKEVDDLVTELAGLNLKDVMLGQLIKIVKDVEQQNAADPVNKPGFVNPQHFKIMAERLTVLANSIQ